MTMIAQPMTKHSKPVIVVFKKKKTLIKFISTIKLVYIISIKKDKFN